MVVLRLYPDGHKGVKSITLFWFGLNNDCFAGLVPDKYSVYNWATLTSPP